MNICANRVDQSGTKAYRAPVVVPLALVVAGLVLMPFDCVYNRLFALFIIGLGSYSLITRASELYCCMRSRSKLLSTNPAAEAPSCF
jgi:hypothetical protein